MERQRRPRRLASDEAHAWARNLRLGNLHAKMVLSMLSLYVDGDGACFVGIPGLADDCELSPDTVRRRLAWLDEIGAIAREPQWLDEYGNRNSEGRGKRTTDKIRLLVDADQDAIEARAKGRETTDSDAGTVAISPGCQQGLKDGTDDVSTRLALGQPSQSGEGLISEPEPEDSPRPPSGGRVLVDPKLEGERRAVERRDALWTSFKIAYPGIASMDQQVARTELDELSIDDAEWAVSVCPAYDAECRKLRKPPKNAHIWLRKRMFANFPKAKIEAPPPEAVWIAEGSDADRALSFVRGWARAVKPFVGLRDGVRGYPHKGQPGEDLLAMLSFAEELPSRWPAVKRGSDHFAAWQRRVSEWIGQGVALDHGSDEMRVPTLWPPKKDGTIYRDEQHHSDEGAGA